MGLFGRALAGTWDLDRGLPIISLHDLKLLHIRILHICHDLHRQTLLFLEGVLNLLDVSETHDGILSVSDGTLNTDF